MKNSIIKKMESSKNRLKVITTTDKDGKTTKIIIMHPIFEFLPLIGAAGYFLYKKIGRIKVYYGPVAAEMDGGNNNKE